MLWRHHEDIVVNHIKCFGGIMKRQSEGDLRPVNSRVDFREESEKCSLNGVMDPKA